MLHSLSSTFRWPVCSIQFLAEGKPIAILNAVKIKDTVFSLPHADSLGFSFSESQISISPIHQVSPSPHLPLSPSSTPALEIICELLPHSGLYDEMGTGLINKTIELTDEELVDKIKSTPLVRDIQIRSTLPLLKYRSSHKVISTLSLEGGYENVVEKLTANVRRKVNKALKNGVTVKAGHEDLLDDFYRIYRHNIHKHGSFGLPEAYYKNLSPLDSMIFVAYLSDKPIGSALLTWMLDKSENTAFATLPEFNQLYTSYALHDAMINASVFLGCRTYSMGRCTPGSPVHKYKQQWGTVDEVLYYNSSMPLTDKISKYNFIRPVLKAMPLWLVQRFDHFVAKRIY